MHHPRSISAIVRLRIAALLLLVICLLVPLALGLLIGSIVTSNFQLTVAGSSLLLVSVVLIMPQWAAGASTGCPLCWTPVLAPKSCTKHRSAKTLLGSHRLRVAMAILVKNQFRCPYCNEPTSLELHNMLHRPTNRWARLD